MPENDFLLIPELSTACLPMMFHYLEVKLSLLVRVVHLHSTLDLLYAIAYITDSVFVLLQSLTSTGRE